VTEYEHREAPANHHPPPPTPAPEAGPTKPTHGRLAELARSSGVGGKGMTRSPSASSVDSAFSDTGSATANAAGMWWAYKMVHHTTMLRKREELLAVGDGADRVHKTSMMSVKERHEYTLLSRDHDDLQHWVSAIQRKTDDRP